MLLVGINLTTPTGQSNWPQYFTQRDIQHLKATTDAIRWHYDEAEACSQQGWYALYYYDATAAQESVFFPLFRAEAETRGNAQLPLAIHLGADKYLRIEATLTTALQYGVLAFHEQLKGTRNADEAIQQLLAFEKGSGAYDDFPDALEVTLRWCFQHFPARGQALKTPLIGKRRWAGY